MKQLTPEEHLQYLEDFHHAASGTIGLVHWNLKQANDLNELTDKGQQAFQYIDAFVRKFRDKP